MSPVKTSDFSAEVAESVGGTFQSVGGAHDGDVVPHQAADFIPVVVNDDLFIRLCGVAVFPFWDVGCFG